MEGDTPTRSKAKNSTHMTRFFIGANYNQNGRGDQTHTCTIHNKWQMTIYSVRFIF